MMDDIVSSAAGALVEGLGAPEDVRLDLLAAVTAVLAGGRAAMEFYDGARLDIEDPHGRGPVTAADRASNVAMTEVLTRLDPDASLRSEEGARDETGRNGRLWIIDPLDGTKEFIAGIDEFSVMAGLAENGVAALGAVYRPAIDRLYLGAPGVGAWVTEDTGGDVASRPLGPVGERPSPIRMVQSRSHPDPRLERLAVALGEVDVILSGSAGTKCALVASGEADLYVHPVPYLKEWDTCAPEAVLRGAGGRVTDCSGRPLAYGADDPRQQGGIFAAMPGVYDRVADVVFEIGASFGS